MKPDTWKFKFWFYDDKLRRQSFHYEIQKGISCPVECARKAFNDWCVKEHNQYPLIYHMETKCDEQGIVVPF